MQYTQNMQTFLYIKQTEQANKSPHSYMWQQD